MTTPELWMQGSTSDLLNHLCQSTVIALLAWLLTIALRKNCARVRYAIWLSASIKFLIPFCWLSSLGAHWARRSVTHTGQAFYFMVEEFSRPIRQAQLSVPHSASITPATQALPIAFATIGAIWLIGCAILLARWIAGWQDASRMAQKASPLAEGREFVSLRRAERKAGIRSQIPLVLAASETEPGVFGVFNPVLLWPIGLSRRLDDAQVEAIMAHEVEHVRRRDNLTAAIHAFVEALFWFHPLVRWMSTKMNEERERACDEKVIAQSAKPEAYAESILKVCAFCMEPPTPCVSGVSGANLKDRILRIMARRSGVKMSSARKAVLYAAAVLILATPIGFGVLRGQSSPSATTAASQSPIIIQDLPKYEVASIKATAETENRRTMMMTPDGTSMHGVDVQMLLQQAFGVESDRILGAPGWVKSNRYDIEAKVAPEEAPKMEKLKVEERREMLLPLLQERLNLKYHHESRELPTYVLVVAKGGPKLTQSKPGSPVPPPSNTPGATPGPGGPPRDPIGNRGMMMMNPGRIEAHGGGMFLLSHALSALVGRTVVDKTGLTGNYDFSLNWTPDESMRNLMGGPGGGPEKGDADPEAGGPSLFTAVQEQLGLKLESQKDTLDVIVIDHIDLPSQN